MIISFDIDNTLIPYGNEFDVEPKPSLHGVFGGEQIRHGTVSLFRDLEQRGHTIWLYTTSYRSRWNLRKSFLMYGLWPQKIINGDYGSQVLQANNCSASKNPALFGIDLHVDDSKGVEAEGLRYGFATLIIATDGRNWTSRL